VDGAINDQIDDAYREKQKGQPISQPDDWHTRTIRDSQGDAAREAAS
jgi:hypothetical protein